MTGPSAVIGWHKTGYSPPATTGQRQSDTRRSCHRAPTASGTSPCRCAFPADVILVRAGCRNYGDRVEIQLYSRRNHLDIHGIISSTAALPAGRDRSRPITSASASSPSTVNGQRPSAMTAKGSAGATSVQLAGRENNSPLSSCKWTRSSPQFWRCAANSKSRPNSGVEPVRYPHTSVLIIRTGRC